MNKVLIFITFGFLASGCATYTKDECSKMDQAQSGYKLGIDGKNSFEQALIDLKKNCEKEYGVQVNEQKIKQGWEDGLRFYCSDNGGVRAGSNGLTYTGVCKKDDEKKFFEAFNPARMTFLENKVKELENKIESLTTEVSTCESHASSLQGQLSSAESRPVSCP